MAWKTLDEMELAGKVVLTRVDINVPVKDGKVTDDTRIQRILPTIRDILAAGGKPVLLAHFGRPKGERVPDMSLSVVRPALEAALGRPVKFAEDCIGGPAKQAVAALEEGDVLLLENTRYHAAETKNDPAFAAGLAALGDIYCNDAFSAAHRAHGSTEGVARLLPSCAGRLMQAELSALEAALGQPERPVVAVVGGAKVSTKLDLLGNLVSKVDHLVIGGGMANTFLAAQGIDVGKSLAEHEMADTAREILAKADTVGCEVILPSDVVVAREFAAGAASETVPADACPADAMILDAGPESVAKIADTLSTAKTLIWNGPLGAFEIEPFDAATNAAAAKAAELSADGKLTSVAGGGDTVAALNKAGATERFTYISTAGGAFLEWMEGKELPGVAALSN
ncbi:Bifunctional PGK/TIM [Aliiroseovarius sp. xm-m-379]|uniref:phosphoglycerate kinase n=1 Tax=unclassified Aliiroseovarius TaxID=2623558 RepID=UPI001568A1E9|nr:MULTISPECIES: phosphoglycerate kinase [unclassified Aliiroseovarius]NRP11673.1 Bifunctional PGK/TIM [Aliiroseovarius sp. xm-d-517]NRP25714.1 Bifunctional PGK/TIM [Aliiroseovarius sp. xm-m-379]NRP31220.1 Bifunctional PGK/TIM [Aliiroseovarius sp. xm-m-314]NRP34513.1 Bifunctional PGK/TIM [Aliiroseovarius sp. xm-a-104]NRP41948.1 Bifunctional PGK/TIM [Aliiroseovarius sp. xm-m-339-2]